MRFKGLLLAAVSLLLVTSCNGGGESSPTTSSTEPTSTSTTDPLPPEPEVLKLRLNLAGSLHAGKVYQLEFDYEDAFFSRNAKTYDKEMSMLSYGAAMSTDSFAHLKNYYEQAKFKAITGKNYDVTPTEDTAGYSFAYKLIDDYYVVAVTFRGLNYGAEWSNNFIMGKSGDHEGFLARATEAFSDLNAYVSEHCSDKTLKLWINGYSRGGALANVLSSLILRSDCLNVRQEDMFTYTFEAPYCLSEENSIAYENVHNIINSNDLITNIPPAAYGFGRCGVDYPIYDENISTLAREFDNGLIIPEFVEIDAGKELTNDQELCEFIVETTFEGKVAPEGYECRNRDEYVDRYQEGLSYAIGLMFALSDSTRSALLASLTSLDMMSLLAILGDDTGKALADFIKPYLDNDHIEYDYDILVARCLVLRNAIYYVLIQPLLIFANETYRPSVTRLIDMHYPESVYVLLVNAHKK